MKEECEFLDNFSSRSIKKSSGSKEIKDPLYKMTIESEKGRKEVINIYSNSKPEEIAYNFCKENNLDFQTLELMIKKIKKLMESISKNKENKELEEKDNQIDEKENKLFYCNEPILEDSEEQQSISTEKIMRTKSFKDNNIFKSKEKEKNNKSNNKSNNNINNNINITMNSNISNSKLIENINLKINDSNNNNINYLKINEDFKGKKLKNSKTSAVITNTINNCLELIEKEEKNILSSISTFSSKLGSSSIKNQNLSNNSKENINIFKLEKEKEKDKDSEEILLKKSITSNNKINPKITISKSFINNIPSNMNNNYLNGISRNNYLKNKNNNNNNIKNQQVNKIELDSKTKTVSDEHKYSNKIKSLKNSTIINLNSYNNNEYYKNIQKEILKNNKNKNFQRIINMIKKNNIDISQISNDNFSKNKRQTMKTYNNYSNNNSEQKKRNFNYKIKQKNNIHYGINNSKISNLKTSNINNNYIQNSKENIYHIDTNDKENFYSLSKNEETSTLNNLIKNSMSTNSHYFSNNMSNNKIPISENFNSIKHEINITILSNTKKLNNRQKNNNIIIFSNNNKNNKSKNRNCQTLSSVDKNKHSYPHDKLIKDFKTKILLTKNNDLIKRQINLDINYDKKKKSPLNDNHKINNIKKKYNFINNMSLYSPLMIRDFFIESNLKKYRSNFKSPQHKSNTTQTTMKNFIIKKNKTNIYKDSLINNKILLNQSSRNNNLNDYSSFKKQRCNSFNDFNSNINNIFINLKYSNNKKSHIGPPYLEKFNLDSNSYFNQHNKRKASKKRNINHALSSNKVANSHSINKNKFVNKTSDKSLKNNINLNLNITTESNNNSYSLKNRKLLNINNKSTSLKNKINNKGSSKSNFNKKKPCYLFIKSQNLSPLSSSRKRKKKNHSTLLQNSSLTISLIKKNKITNSLKNIFYYLSNKNNQIDIFKINKKNFIPDDIIKSVQYILQNCEQNKGTISINEFIMKGTLLFDNLPFDDQISILNFVYEK